MDNNTPVCLYVGLAKYFFGFVFLLIENISLYSTLLLGTQLLMQSFTAHVLNPTKLFDAI